jgi:asparagine synthase (glutamine-hydrolysing)
LLGNSHIKKVFSPVWNDVSHVSTKNIFREALADQADAPSCPEDFINQSLYLEAKTFLHGLFVVEDKLSMAHGLENRVPFMDNDLVDFAMKCPVNMKLNNLSEVLRLNENFAGSKTSIYFQKTNDGKQILRDVMARYIPSSITQAEKQGFSSPDASWFSGESIDFVNRRLLSKNSPIFEYLDYQSVTSLVLEHLEGCQNRRLLIWSLLNVDEYIRQVL